MNKKYKLYSGLSVLVAVLIFVLLNIFMTVLAKRIPTELDLTSNSRYELSKESYAFLKKYNKDTDIYMLASETDEDKAVRAVINKYEVANSHIKIHNIDLAQNPAFGLEYVEDGEKLTSNSVVVDADGKARIISEEELYSTDYNHETALDAESKITSALKYVSSEDEIYKVYFTTGHKEQSFIAAAEALEKENYELWELATANTNVPEDAALLLIANPTSDFTNEEIAKIDAYVRSGGNVQIYVTGNSPSLPNLNAYLEKNGITIRDNIIVDKNAHVSESTFLMNYADNDVSKTVRSENRYSAYMGFSKWIDYSSVSGAINVSEYLTSMNDATTMKNIKELESDNIMHYENPSIALMSENMENGGKIFVCGNTLLLEHSVSEITNAGYDNVVYFTVLTNSMCKEESEIFVVSSKSIAEQRLVITESTQKVWLTVFIAIPILFIIGGLAVFFKRRNM